MKRLAIILAVVLMTSGCGSLIPRITTDTPNTVPQATQKSKAKYKCAGKIEYYEDGSVKYCSKGFYAYDESYNKEERRMTLVERVKSFFNAILAWGIPGVIVLCFLFPSLFTVIGTMVGRAIEGAFGAGVVTLKRVVKAVQRVRKDGKDLDESLSSELDQKQKLYIQNLKNKENIK